MTFNNHEKYYFANEKYSQFLDNQDIASFQKYTDIIAKYANNKNEVLDVGCGTGLAIELLLSKGCNNCTGIEISQSSVNICMKKKLDCKLYNGKKFPMNKDSFDVVASINVLEHTDNPINFLNEMYRVLRKNGYIIIVCPNFLSITNNYHKNTKGIFRKIINIGLLIKKLFSRHYNIEKMVPVDREDFHPDDDAINATNPIDIILWAKSKGLKLEYWSSQQQKKPGITSVLDVGPLRALFGSCFFVYKKV